MPPAPETTPAYQDVSEEAFTARIEDLRDRYGSCDLCAHECGVDRTAGETGVCGIDTTPRISSHFAHRGEEDVLRGHNGSGTIFLANCNMQCVFCQNFEISQQGRGEPVTATEIAEMALELQAQGCHNVNFVSPTHHSPHLVEAISRARDRGLEIPIVWNCGGYERAEIIKRLDGIVDIYMPDVKWSEEAAARRYSKAPNYWSNVRESLREMHRQVGDLEVDDNGLATSGLLVRHLLLPKHVENAKQVLSFLANEISEQTYLNLLSQYRPHYKVPTDERYSDIDQRVTPAEYQAVLSHARSVGLERVEYDAAMAGESVSTFLG
ncbi:radical SAM protein [Halodesulfurarchaeum sp.]|uniref:radical SAM protein n=1 Tax=Halodesulfurarchaeum sp. TaxID=1980530 RepID=UPI002FC27CFE